MDPKDTTPFDFIPCSVFTFIIQSNQFGRKVIRDTGYSMTTANTSHAFRPLSPACIAAQNSAPPATILDCSPDPLLLLDETARIRMLNRAAVLSYAIEEKKAVGRSCATLCFRGSERIFQTNFDQCLQTAKPVTWERARTTPPRFREQITLLPPAPLTGTGAGIIVHGRNISCQEMMEEQMLLADRFRTLDRLAGGIAHQVRNPLSAIMLFSDILADERRFTRSGQELELLADINTNIRLVTDIITRIQGFTDRNASPDPCLDINDMIRDILQLWSPILKRTGIKANFSPEPDLPCVAGNRAELGQAVSALVRNAMEAMDTGGALTLATALTQSAQNEEKVVITCADTGPGIDEELENFIFNPFFSTKQGNSGMGLTIARWIVNRHGGRIFCQSAEAGKTVFCIELPLAPEPQTDECNS